MKKNKVEKKSFILDKLDRYPCLLSCMSKECLHYKMRKTSFHTPETWKLALALLPWLSHSAPNHLSSVSCIINCVCVFVYMCLMLTEIEFTYNKIHPLQYSLHKDNISIPSKSPLWPFVDSPFWPPAPDNHQSVFCPFGFVFSRSHISGII